MTRYRWWALGILALAQLTDVMDVTIINIALPRAQADLGFSDLQRQWIVTAYALAFGALLLTGGRLADRFGARRALLAGLVGFAVASAVGGLAPNFTVLVTARAFQGASGALLAPAVLSLLNHIFTEPAERRRAFAVFGGVTGAGGAVGLVLGGVLTEHLNWRWGMYVNVPIVVVVLVACLFLLRSTKPSDPVPVNLPSAVVAAAGLGLLVYGFDHAGSAGWGDPATLTLIGAGVVATALFVLMQARSSAPLLPLRIVADRKRGAALVAVALTPVAMFSMFLFIVYYLQQILGFSPLQSGMAFLPLLGGVVVGAVTASAKPFTRIPAAAAFVGAALVGAFGIAWLTALPDSGRYWPHIGPGLIIAGLGVGVILALAINLATAGVAERDTGVASALVNALQQIGGALGVALLNAIAAQTTTSRLHAVARPTQQDVLSATVSGFTSAFFTGTVILVAAGVIAAFLLPRTKKPADTPVPVTTAKEG
ncbi:MFS transporter [Amycolatopsis jejuensis]|uniref:MFS transporter n=1 Tax=Amycolatopsis jejuensis TaxID=330084 RepID=UPI000689436B|nr:MFS transporter [Amycolatopsis jejuensis]